MGTTLTMAFAADWRLFVAHAGDSRCYLFSRGELHRLTAGPHRGRRDGPPRRDRRRGAARHPYRHVVTNVLGGHEPGVRVDVHKLDLEPGDVVLLCSDGLTDMVG